MPVGRHSRRFILLAAVLLVLTTAADALAWGPATHIRLAGDLLTHLDLLPAAVAALILKYRGAFTYGNVATDTVFAKKMSRIKQICHHWGTGFRLLDTASDDEARAFALGYLAHLAADTVAHNKYLPRQMAVSRSSIVFGHLYWEIRADAQIETRHWSQLRRILRTSHEPLEALLETQLRETMLSFRTNLALFKSMNMIASERSWRRSVDLWSRLSRFQLDPTLLGAYRDESLGRIADVLTRGEASTVLHEDPNGNAALAHAKAQRKQLRQFHRARIPHHHVVEEAAAGHAPDTSHVLILNDKT